MSFNKLTSFGLDNDDIEVLDGDIVKVAMKLPEGFAYDPDYLYLKVKAVSAGEYWGSNKNDDFFPEEQLKRWHKTFLAAHVFKNHENKKIEGAIGDVLTSEWNDKMKAVYLVIRIDKKIAPSIVRGFEKGFMTDVSMGCRVDHVVCSYCGKAAKTRFDYCEHLKIMKGKTMDNGKKVFEINIAPKFHDISAVLNGAERTAKAEDMKPSGGVEKVAMEKVASVQRKEEYSIVDTYTDSVFEKVAKDKSVDSIKKTLETKSIANALSDITTEKLGGLEKIIGAIKGSYENKWDRESCISIGTKLRVIATEEKKSPEKVFAQFLKVLDIAGIEISPLEMHDIMFEALNIDSHDLRGIMAKSTIGESERIHESLNHNMPIPSILKMVKSVMGNCGDSGFGELCESPVKKIKMIMIKARPIDNDGDDSLGETIMRRIVKDMMPDRSNHRNHLIPRLEKISKGEVEKKANDVHYLVPKFALMDKVASEYESVAIPSILSSLVYSAYQRDRVNDFNSGELDNGIRKMAHIIGDLGFEKVAKKVKPFKPLKATVLSVPVITAYSALQRSRMNNGERISGANRYIAENPDGAALLGALATYSTTKRLKKALPKVLDTVSKLKKKASEYDIFEDEDINNIMLQKYSSPKLELIKIASVALGRDQEDLAEDVLTKESLSLSDIDEYLKVSSTCFKIDIEKNAKDFTSSIDKISMDSIMVGSNTFPADMVDGIILSALEKGLKNAIK